MQYKERPVGDQRPKDHPFAISLFLIFLSPSVLSFFFLPLFFSRSKYTLYCTSDASHSLVFSLQTLGLKQSGQQIILKLIFEMIHETTKRRKKEDKQRQTWSERKTSHKQKQWEKRMRRNKSSKLLSSLSLLSQNEKFQERSFCVWRRKSKLLRNNYNKRERERERMGLKKKSLTRNETWVRGQTWVKESRGRNEKAFRIHMFSCCQQIGHNLFSPQSLLFLLLLLSLSQVWVELQTLWVYEMRGGGKPGEDWGNLCSNLW